MFKRYTFRCFPLLITILLFSVGAHSSAARITSPASDFRVLDCKKITDADRAKYRDPNYLLSQAERPFESKFSVISTDIAAQGEKNLASFKGVLEQKRPGFSRYLEQADQLVEQADSMLSLEHETSLGGLKGVLKSGAIMSMDELIRRKILPPTKKLGSTRPDVDGETGEQDVVFVALRAPFTSDYAATYGDYTLTLDQDRLMELAYFTPFQYFSGIKMGLLFSDGFDFQCAVPHYRKWIFRGKEQYRGFLKLSIAQILWERDHDFARVQEPLERLAKTCASQNDDSSLEDKGLAQLMPIFMHFQQAMPSDLPLKCEQIWGPSMRWLAFNSNTGKQDHELVRTTDPLNIPTLLQAYQGFPSDVGDFPPFMEHNPKFWEFKVPRTIPLDVVKSIAIPKECLDAPIPSWCQGATEAITEYAKRSNRKFSVSLAPHRMHKEVVVYTFGN